MCGLLRRFYQAHGFILFKLQTGSEHSVFFVILVYFGNGVEWGIVLFIFRVFPLLRYRSI